MIHQIIQQETDLWEAWIEFDHVARDCFGTLYVMGEVMAAKKAAPPKFLKCVRQNEPETLILRISAPLPGTPVNSLEVVYFERLQHVGHYERILVYMEDELLTCIEDIEVVV